MSVGSVCAVGSVSLIIVGALVGVAIRSRLNDEDVMRELERDACDLCRSELDIGQPRCPACGWHRGVRRQDGMGEVFVARQALRAAMDELERAEEAGSASQQDLAQSGAAVQGHLERALDAMPGFRPQIEGAGDLLHTLRLLEYDLRQMLLRASREL